MSEDPIRWFSGTINFYDYVHNDPGDLTFFTQTLTQQSVHGHHHKAVRNPTEIVAVLQP